MNAPQQIAASLELLVAQRSRVPLLAVHIVDGDERRFAAHGEPDVLHPQVLVNAIAQMVNRLPLLVGIGECDTRRFVDPAHRHMVLETYLARVHQAGNGGG